MADIKTFFWQEDMNSPNSFRLPWRFKRIVVILRLHFFRVYRQ